MPDITIERNVSPIKLETLAVELWPIWSKEESTFDWHYEQNETCYILEGEATITPENGATVSVSEGDLVNFSKGLSCQWNITSAISKHYMLK